MEKEIGKHQIISEIDMQGFGFNKVSFGNELRIYRKITRTCIWEIYLNIIKPKELMIFQKAISRENKNSFSFKIKNLEEFRTLLIQLELI